MRPHNHDVFLIFASALLATATAAWAQPPAPDLNTIVARMEKAEAAAHAQLPAYSVTRAYKFYGGGSQKPNSEVIAKVDYQPPASKSFSIEQKQGSGEGAKIVRKVLEHETEDTSNPQNKCEIRRDNYDFTYLGAELLDGRPAYVLGITPKHSSKETIHGRIWVDSNSSLIRRVEGDLAKSPSWWIKDVHVVVNYGRIAGLWLQTATFAVANVRLLGKRSMVAEALACQPKMDVALVRP